MIKLSVNLGLARGKKTVSIPGNLNEKFTVSHLNRKPPRLQIVFLFATAMLTSFMVGNFSVLEEI
jgi:hypothetical protein